MTQEDKRQRFIEKAKLIHPNENLDYSEVVYINNRTPVKIIDRDLDENGNEYGPFYPLPCNFLKGQGHRGKRGKKISKSKRSKQDEIIERFKQIHRGENLDYSQVKYVNMHTKVKIISHDLRPDGTEYGEFWQEPVVHLKGCTHPEIGKLKQSTTSRYTTQKFIDLAKKVHYDKDYSYDLVDYKTSKTKVSIICNKIGTNGLIHGVFKTNPDLFLQGKGCPICGYRYSKAQTEIYHEIGKRIGYENVELGNNKILDGMEIDIFIPSKNIGIEYNGLRWHGENFGKGKSYHYDKMMKARENGIYLIQVFEDEYLHNKNIVYDKIFNSIGLDGDKPKINARECEVFSGSGKNDKIVEFLDNNHIQGYAGNSVYYYCTHKGEMIGAMLFKNEGDCWNLVRFCTDNRYICRGVASKLFKHFVRDYKPETVKSFLDRRWSHNDDNNVYTKMGFVKDSILGPEYRYTKGNGERLHKFGFRKQLLLRKYGSEYNLNESMTENEMTKIIGYDRIWDCGLIKYVWKAEK